MDDLISRQAVLEATSTTLKITGKENAETVYGYIKKLCDDIKALPSAQQWIPCSERLPEKSGKYLVSCKANAYSNITTTAQWQNRYKYWYMTGARSHWRVDAWMPLPDCYQGDEK